MEKYLEKSVIESCLVKEKSLKKQKKNIIKIVNLIYNSLKRGKKILLMGNGGSAADAQHIAAEFVVRLKENRKAYPAIALTTDTSILTSCGNDFGFDLIFKRQIEAYADKGDIVIAISTSGNSKNVLYGIDEAKKKGLKIVGFTGEGGGAMKEKCNILVDIESKNTMRIQEAHITFLHIICDMVEKKLKG